MNAQEILEQLTDLYAERDVLILDHNNKRNAAVPKEILDALYNIDAEYAPKFDEVNSKIEKLAADAKQLVLEAGETVKGGALQAVYTKGRVSWDGKKLDGMMALVPGLSAARKEGEPSVSIRKVG